MTNLIKNNSKKAMTIVVASLLLPIIILLALFKFLIETIFLSYYLHSFILIIASLLSFFITFYSHVLYKKNNNFRLLLISLSFYGAGLILLLHAILVPEFLIFNELVFDITEHYGFFVGSLLMFLIFLPIPEVCRKGACTYKNSIFVTATLLLAAFITSIFVFPTFAEILESYINVVTLLTSAPYLLLSVVFVRNYLSTGLSLSFYFAAGFGVLVSIGIIPLFYEEGNIIWWYFHLVFIIGFTLILTGLIKDKSKDESFSKVFSDIPLYSKISTKLSGFVILISVIPLVAISIPPSSIYRENLIQQVYVDMVLLIESKESQIFQYIDALVERTVDFSSDGYIRDSLSVINSHSFIDENNQENLYKVTSELNSHLVKNKKSLDNYITDILILNPEGVVVASTNVTEISEDKSNNEYYIKGLISPYYNEIDYKKNSNESHYIAVSAPIKDRLSNEILGVIVNIYNSKEMTHIFSGSLDINVRPPTDNYVEKKKTKVYIVNDHKEVFVQPDGYINKDLKNKLVDTLPVRECLNNNEEINDTYLNFDGEEVLGVSRCLTNLDWVLLVELNSNDLLTPISSLQKILLSVILLVSIVIIFLSVFFSNWLMKPLETLINVSKKISSGDMSARAEINSKNEVGRLATSLNAMAEELFNRSIERDQQEKESKDKAEKLSLLNLSLEDTKRATLNILEDLDEEKKMIEVRIEERTKELVEEKSKLSHVTENMRTGTIFIDEHNIVSFVNKSAKKILKITDDETKNILLNFKRVFPGVDYKKYLNVCSAGQDNIILPEVTSSKKIYELEFKCLHGSTENDEVGHYGTFIWLRDITEQKLLERSKSELVAVASHQLRTPLTIARGNLEMLIDGSFGEVSDKQQELLHDTEDSVIRLIELVNDMLDITKIEKGDIDLVLSKFSILMPLDIVLNNINDYAKRHDFNISIDKPDGTFEVFADSSRLVQIFQNLIDNAIRYGRTPGKVDVSFSIKDNMAVVSVGDNGIGIPDTERDNIFGRFYRASNAVKFASNGSGLGLFIVKSLVEQMGGTVWFESIENVGTKFFFTLPLNETK